MNCDHVWRHQGAVYWYGGQLPGSGAVERIYGDRYFCEKCLETKILNERTHGHNYQKPIEGTLPR